MTVAPPAPQIFDGDCGFCRMWVEFAQSLTGEKVEYVPYQTAADRFPRNSAEDFGRGSICSPEGRFRGQSGIVVTGRSAWYGWLLWLYRHLPGFAALRK